MDRYNKGNNQLKTRPWLWAVRSFLALALLLSSAAAVVANSLTSDQGHPPTSKPTALVMAPLTSSEELFSVAQRIQESGFTVYEHLGNQSGEFLLALSPEGAKVATPITTR